VPGALLFRTCRFASFGRKSMKRASQRQLALLRLKRRRWQVAIFNSDDLIPEPAFSAHSIRLFLLLFQ